MSYNVLVYGWYGRHNVGDELMRAALVGLFESRGCVLEFVDTIDDDNIARADGVIFGGGSILFDAPRTTPIAFAMMLTRKVPVFYVGVGQETHVHPRHRELIDVAQTVAYRERDIPDLAYSLRWDVEQNSTPSGILIVPNVETLPTSADPHWVHVAWEHYKNELAQALDHFVEFGHTIEFLLMCRNNHMDDMWAASGILGSMKRGGWKKVYHDAKPDSTIRTIMAKHQVVITQRYHGIIVAEMAGTPYVALDHHDKLKNVTPHRGQHLSYHGVTKSQLIESISGALTAGKNIPFIVPEEVYDRLADSIVEQIGQHSVK